MSEIVPLIIGSEKPSSIFGRWPSFHDAEVHELNFQRGHIDREDKIYESPCLNGKTSSVAYDKRYRPEGLLRLDKAHSRHDEML
jgi:hypothetical protein